MKNICTKQIIKNLVSKLEKSNLRKEKSSSAPKKNKFMTKTNKMIDSTLSVRLPKKI